MLEYNSEMFTKISFLFEWNDFYFIIIGKFVKTLSVHMHYRKNWIRSQNRNYIAFQPSKVYFCVACEARMTQGIMTPTRRHWVTLLVSDQ